MADAYAFENLPARSVETYEESVKRVPTWPDNWIYLGRAKIAVRRRKEGLEDIARGATLAPYNRDILLDLIVRCLRAARDTPWEEEKEGFRKMARRWLEQSEKLPRPLSKSDLDYIGHMGRLSQKLSKEDLELMLSLWPETSG